MKVSRGKLPNYKENEEKRNEFLRNMCEGFVRSFKIFFYSNCVNIDTSGYPHHHATSLPSK